MNSKLRKGAWIMATVGLVVVAAFAGSLAAATPARAATAPKARPAGASHAPKTSFHFNDIPVRSALQILAEEGGFNLVVSDSVSGNISLHLDDVTWEQALEIVLRMKGLSQRVDGSTRAVGAAGG